MPAWPPEVCFPEHNTDVMNVVTLPYTCIVCLMIIPEIGAASPFPKQGRVKLNGSHTWQSGCWNHLCPLQLSRICNSLQHTSSCWDIYFCLLKSQGQFICEIGFHYLLCFFLLFQVIKVFMDFAFCANHPYDISEIFAWNPNGYSLLFRINIQNHFYL